MPRRRSTTPPRHSRGGSTPPGGSGGGGGSGALVIHRVTKEISSSGSFPTLTRSNYYDWAACMRVMLQARGLWIAVSIGTDDLTEDRMALEVLTKAVPAMGTIANKATAKIAWDSIKLMNVGVERVRKAKASTLRREFDSLKFKDGETVDDFGIRINRIANQLAVLGGGLKEEEIVRKFLQALPPRFEQIASSIETLLDLEDVTLLIGRLKATEERHGYSGNDTIAKLNLTEDELVARISSRLQLTGGGSGSNSGVSSSGGSVLARNAVRSRHREKGAAVADAVADAAAAAADPATTVVPWRATNHRECRKKKRDEQAHVAQTEGQALLVATTTIATATSTEVARSTSSGVHLDESRLYVQLGDKGGGGHTEWILDTGATNHMTGVRSAFSELDTGIHGTVRFGDGSVAGIEGRGTILFKCKNGEHQALGGVYHIPRLTANVISLGQMEEAGFKILLDQGCLKIWDQRRQLLAKVPRGANRLYTLKLDIAKPVCLAAQGTSTAWRWHARFGHLNFRGLRRLAQEEMVRGLPQIEHVDQVCDSCLAGKQRRLAFPTEAKYRAAHKLELVHGDLCGPVTPTTPSGNKLFFLLVDDLSRYMWLILLSTKDQAITVFTAFQARRRGVAAVSVYVDDLLITGEQQTEIEAFKVEMKKLFKMSDLGPLSYYLGIEVKQGWRGIELRQSAYADKLLEKAGMGRCNACATPMEVRLQLSKQGTSPMVDATMYRSLIGSLRYLLHTRPELTFAVGYLSRFMEEPRMKHMAAMKQLLRYVKGTCDHGLHYTNNGGKLNLLGYSDSGMAGDVDGRKSTTGVIFFLGGNPVTWLSQKQRVVALSSCEAEFIAGAAAACQAVWLRRLLEDITGAKAPAPILKMDNQSAIALSKNPVLHDRSKHIDTRFHFIRECSEKGDINIEFAGTQDQLADILTKPLGRKVFQELRGRIGVIKLA
ncbi:LOW QUALITY PROTEIN: hypothetical protein U9M48_009898 [Paspalum notatum var. saurae]|uniref:Uncharacterized protein n=1 Tax=Paspalum notatum var. saurae TaxID=547442 RepID=A0AAQ3WFF4_PASNO